MPQLPDFQRPDGWPNAPRSTLASGQAVVVGYDGSEASRRAIARAAVAGAEGRVLVVTARPLAHWLHGEALADATPPESVTLLDEAANLLAAQGVEAHTRAAQGDPAEALIKAAREVEAALIVVGARGCSYLERTLRGSVAERLVARAPCDVLVVR